MNLAERSRAAQRPAGDQEGSAPALTAKGRTRLASCCCQVALLSVLFWGLGGCAGLPSLRPLDPAELSPPSASQCLRPFPQDPTRLVHALTMRLPGEQESVAIGVLQIDPASGRFRSILMTVEGLVLFDIEKGETLQVHRSVPPFDAPAFSRRMAEDIGLAFFAPGTRPGLLGRDEQGAFVCRYGLASAETLEVATGASGAVEIRLYGAGQEPRKRVRIPLLERPGLADSLEIQGLEWPGYQLRLRLIEAEPTGKDEGTP